jgi:hypothetical protein
MIRSIHYSHGMCWSHNTRRSVSWNQGFVLSLITNNQSHFHGWDRVSNYARIKYGRWWWWLPYISSRNWGHFV